MKIIIQMFCILLSVQLAKANSVTIKLFNNSNATIHCTDLKIHNGSLRVKDYGNPFYGKVYGPGTNLELKTGSADAFCGTDGFVEFRTSIQNITYQFMITFDNPFIGTNEYSASATNPFIIRHLNGGSGSDMVLSYELIGGPPLTPAPPPIPPIHLPTSGNKTIKGTFTWNINDTGLPSEEDLTKAFDISVKAPTEFIVNASGKSEQTYQSYNGYYNNIQEIKNVSITFTDERYRQTNSRDMAPNPLNPQRTIRYQINNLPENIPLVITANPTNSKWKKGKNIPENSNQEAKWIAFLLEKNKTENVINYTVAAAWFDGEGNSASDATGGLKSEYIKNLKNFRPQSDFGGNQEDFRKRNVIRPAQTIERTTPLKEQNGIEKQNIDSRRQKNSIKQSNNNYIP
ncbi:MAG: hypothetical protein IPK62_14110 [Bacteroidetes bacterium]|nr:hypothetical protein [Bacteroidota bacterium]MBP6315228.1 hypothetical protein [Chitinophagaceae bacterium]